VALHDRDVDRVTRGQREPLQDEALRARNIARFDRDTSSTMPKSASNAG
jgi:hypothetical protein